MAIDWDFDTRDYWWHDCIGNATNGKGITLSTSVLSCPDCGAKKP